MKILIYHGPSRPKSAKEIKRYDIVLTTYQVSTVSIVPEELHTYTPQTLSNEWPDELVEAKKKKPKKKSANDSFIVNDDERDGTAPKKKRVYGPLMNIAWYRVVLDEAQYIRNARTRASTAVTHVQSEIRFVTSALFPLSDECSRWCLTGTPLTNGLNDVYGLFRFIQHRPFGDWEKFKQITKGGDDVASRRVQSALAGVILRRTKETELDGRRLIELPQRQESWVSLEFMEEERAMCVFSSPSIVQNLSFA